MSYGRVSRVYAACERLVFASRLQRVRECFLDDLVERLGRDGARLLVVGGGDGRFLEALLGCGVRPEVDYVERSQRMIGEARRRLGARDESCAVNWVCQPFEQWEGGEYDAVVAHFFIDGYEGEEAEGVLRKLAASTREGGVLVVSDFDPSGAWWAALCVKVMQCFFRITCGIPAKEFQRPDSSLENFGMSLQSESLLLGRLIFTTKWHK